MTITRSRLLSGLLTALLLAGCSSYDKQGYGWVAGSKLVRPTPLYLPADAPSISQRFRPQTGPGNINHRGFDILVPSGTPVLAAGDGVVSRVSLSVLYGRQVFVNHGRAAAGYGLQTRYFHLSEQRVTENDRVRRGQFLGYSGLSGLAGGYPHLHFEVHRLDDTEPARAVGLLDPQLFWVDGAGRVTCFDSAREFAPRPVRLTYPVPCRGRAWQ